MPGFNISSQAGAGGDGPSNTVETRRKHRWIFQTIGSALERTILIHLQKANRPSFALEEPEMHHDQEQVYFAGKQTWEPVDMAWYDVTEPDVSEAIWNWLNSVVQVPGALVAAPSDYKVDATLAMIDNTGAPEETWKMFGCWPKEVNWGELNYTDTELQLVEVKMRYDRANRE
jgi:hypothetical protein